MRGTAGFSSCSTVTAAPPPAPPALTAPTSRACTRMIWNLAVTLSVSLLATRTSRNSWRSDSTISFDDADLDGAWELPSLTASDCAGEREMIRYAICLSTMAFEEDAAAAVSWERDASLSGCLERARFASQMASLKHHWETSRGHLRRQHITRAIPANFSTKRGRRQHKQDLRRAGANRKMGLTHNP